MSAAASKQTPSPPYVVETRNREVLRGIELMSPRPAAPHAVCEGALHVALATIYGRRRGPGGPGRPGGWVLMIEPELHLEGEDPIIPDIAGWLGERMPLIPRTAAVKLPPDWVCEVLSPSTARYDRGVKFAAYRKLADLREYLLVDIDQRRLELYRREAGHWILLESEGDGPALRLESVDMTLAPAEAFEDLDENA